LIFLAWVYADEPLKLFQEEFHCACFSKARGKAAKSRYVNKNLFDKFYELMIFGVM